MPHIKAQVTQLIGAAVRLQPTPTGPNRKLVLAAKSPAKSPDLKDAMAVRTGAGNASGIMEVVMKANMEAYGPDHKVEVAYGDLQNLLKEAQTNGKYQLLYMICPQEHHEPIGDQVHVHTPVPAPVFMQDYYFVLQRDGCLGHSVAAPEGCPLHV
jgi:hypothetical protein